ncbi:response regulator [Pelosinus sp. UFO1]|uniref:response regulator n=1 Tax=Pelosinus sp. UFO1 TaxID=484770 RepID=UPI0004D1392D|nr:response regulator [Pelosinus sp. UFO1]AIF50583.1 response regulator receiver protein [Pelosinus sp. UFO1]
MGNVSGNEQSISSVLFVDDEANILSSIRRAVIDEEYVAYFAGSGLEALSIMEKNEISVIVTDMRMPGMDGLQLLKIVKEKYPNTVKIVLSGYTQLSQVLATVNQADIFNFIAKPWDMETELKYVIDKALEHYQLKKNEAQLKEKLEIRNMAYQNVLKKMEVNANHREGQLQHIRKINKLLLESIERIDDNESKFLAMLLNDYIEKLPGGTDEFSVDKLVEALKVLVTADPLYSSATCKVENACQGGVQGNYDLIQLAVVSLLKIVPVHHYGKGLYIQISVKEKEAKVVLDFAIFFLDADGIYKDQYSQHSYQTMEKVMSEIMGGKFTALRKDEKQSIQLEFILEKYQH